MSLTARLKALIAAEGPIPVSTYMTFCLHDPEEGYYATRPGLAEDFTTAPETSQVFGELIGLWAAHEWQAMGRPDRVTLCELGPGRGTLMADALRAATSVPGFAAAAQLYLFEASAPLRRMQAERLSGHAPTFVEDLDALPDQPAILIGNEFLDCLPARQFVRVGGAWQERVVGLDAAGQLRFGLAVDTAPPEPALRETSAELDLQPGLETLIETLAGRARAASLRVLFLDYGPADTPPGDTLRAYRAGEQIDPLAAPGESDLTVDVDFTRLRRLAEGAGLAVAGPVTQGAFLGALGAQARLDRLIAANPEDAETLFAGVSKLVDPAEMGARFKAICLSSSGLAAPAGF